jgi:hypothetical protein
MSDTPMDVHNNPVVTDPAPANPSQHLNPSVGMKKPQYMTTNQGRTAGAGIHNKPGVDIWSGSAFGKADVPTPENPIMPTNTYQGCDCETCKQLNVNCDNCPVCNNGAIDSETQMAMYDSSIGKADPCWEGYVQRGMKPGADGNPVPNCIPVTKTESILFAAKDYTKQTRVDRLFR